MRGYYRELLDEGVLDEIDAVRRTLESVNSSEYDWLSDRYRDLIDLATAPEDYRSRESKLLKAKEDLFDRRGYIESQLGRHGMLGIFESHMVQVENCIWTDILAEHAQATVQNRV